MSKVNISYASIGDYGGIRNFSIRNRRCGVTP